MMSPKLNRAKIIVEQSPIHGYGVFADQLILSGEIIEECVALIFSDPLPKLFKDYTFEGGGSSMLPLGFGALYNHSELYNASCELDEERRCATFLAVRPIQPGEEILISYGKDWFSSRNLKPKQTTLRFKVRKVISAIPSSVLRFVLCLSAILIVTFVSR